VPLAVSACLVWDKEWIGPGAMHYRPRHEFLFYCRGTRWFGGRAEGDVWTFPRDAAAAYLHPTQKPVALIERAIGNSTAAGDVVLDVFGGSGSTLVACARMKRVARLVELDPRYCDVIVERWTILTGKTPHRRPRMATASA
jgi:DNA modification methylase